MGNCLSFLRLRKRVEHDKMSSPTALSTPDLRELQSGNYKKFSSAHYLPTVTVTSATPLSDVSEEQKEYLDSINVISGSFCSVPEVGLGEFLMSQLENVEQLQSEAFVVHGHGVTTYQQLLDEISRTRKAFATLKLQPGSCALFLCSNVPSVVPTMLAALMLNWNIAMLNAKCCGAYAIDDLLGLQPKIIFCTKDVFTIARGLKSELHSVLFSKRVFGLFIYDQHLVVLDSDAAVVDDCTTLTQLLEETKLATESLLSFCWSNERPSWKNLTAFTVWTSGRQSALKMVQLSHFNVVASIIQIREVNKLRSSDRVLGILPLYHPFGLILQLFCCLCAGSTLCVMPKMDRLLLLQCLEEQKVTVCFAVPPILHFLATTPLDGFNLQELQHLFTVAAPASAVTMEKLLRRFPKLILYQGYGLTECSSITHLSRGSAESFVHVGNALPNVDFKIVDVETDVAVGPMCKGEICLRGTQVAKDTSRDINSQTYLDARGWLHTGDIGYFDEDRFLFVTGIHDRKAATKSNASLSPPVFARVRSIRNMGTTPLSSHRRRSSSGRSNNNNSSNNNYLYHFMKKQQSQAINKRSCSSDGSDSVFAN